MLALLQFAGEVGVCAVLALAYPVHFSRKQERAGKS